LALAVPLSRFTSQVGGGSAFYVRLFRHTQIMKTTLLSLALVVLVSACSHNTDSEMTDSGFTKGEIRDFKSVVLQRTTNSIRGFSRSTNGDVTVDTSGEMFVLHHSTNGWEVLHRAETRAVLPK
jgi:hypothetical protein